MTDKVDELDRESEQALLLGEAYKLGEHDVKNGCLIPLLEKLNSLITQQQHLLLDRVLEEVQMNQKGTFTDDAGHDCWYIDDLVRAIQTIKEGLK